MVEMGPSLTLVERVVRQNAAIGLVIFGCLSLPAMEAPVQSRVAAGNTPLISAVSAGHDPLVDAAFEHFYNMEYERSIQEFEKVVDRRPNDPSAVNHLLSAVLMRELYRMGAMNTGEYAN